MRTLAVLLAAAAVALSLTSGSSAKGSFPCRSDVETGVLPDWARAGFSEKAPRMPHVVGRLGGIAALLFARPLVSPPYAQRNNKILWVARYPLSQPSDLRISAQRMVRSRPVGAPVARRVTGGPGPSIVDLPRAGCWRFTLRWAQRVDTLDLVYVPRPT
jgi:hypothetical protein